MLKIKDFNSVSLKTNEEGKLFADIALPSSLNNVKISKAKLKLVVNKNDNSIDNENITINYEYVKNDILEPRWENVDFLSNLSNGDVIYIDFSDELQDAYSLGATNLHLVFSNGDSSTITFNAIDSSNLDVECMSLYEYQTNASFHNIDCGRAGTGAINLATQDFFLNHLDFASDNNILPLKITHNYNSSLKNNVTFFNNNNFSTHCGYGWNLNVQQYLKKIDVQSTSDDKYNQDTTLRFEYIDATGKTQLIEEKYYYLDDEKIKHFVNRKNVEVDLDGNYRYNLGSSIDPNYTEIYTILESSSGLKMVSSIKDIKCSNLVDYEPEELINIRQSLKSLNENKVKYETNYENLKHQYVLYELDKLNYENNTEKATLSTNINYNDLENKIANYLSLNNLTYKTTDIFSNSSFDQIILEISAISRVYKHINSQNNEILTKTFNSDYTTNNQIQSCVENICDCYKALIEIDEQITKLEHQRDLYEMQVPVHYLYNEDNIIYGFGKTADENVFRLILVTDPYENTIFINYEDLDSNKITSILDSAEKTILFNYNKQDLLESIIDSRDRKVNFEYENNLLTKITYSDNTYSQYLYNSDNTIKAIIDQSGLGTYLEYGENEIKVLPLSILDSIKHKNSKYKSNLDLSNLTPYLVEDSYVKINFYDYKTTLISNAKGKSVAYVFNNLGQVINIYENHYSETSDTNNAQAKEFLYADKKLSESISTLPYAKDYLDDVCFDSNAITKTPALYSGFSVVSEYDYSIPSYLMTETGVHTFTNNNQSASITVSESSLSEINEKILDKTLENITLSGWAKANSAFVKNPNVIEKFNDEDIEYSSYINNRKFELRVEINYIDETETQILTKQFDWMNTEWQFCSLPIKLKPKQISSITCYFDYLFNTNTSSVQFSDLSLKECSCEARRYNNEGQLIKSENSTTYTVYSYDDDGNLTAETTRFIHDENEKAYTTTYEYNKNKKLLKSTDHNGIVTENVYNDKGVAIKTMTYYKDEPSRKLYQESNIDEKGKVTSSVNEFGETISKYEYIDGTGIISNETDKNGNITSYDYDSSDTLIGLTSTSKGEENTNIYGYTLTYLTSLKHNNFEYNYEYDNLGRVNKILIANEEYLTKSYTDNSETTTYKNGATFKQTFNDDGNVTSVEYNQTPILENIYDSLGNLIRSIDNTNNETNPHKYFYNKFGKLYKETATQHSTAIEFENIIDEETGNITESKIVLGDKTLNYAYNYDEDLDGKLNNVVLPNNLTQYIVYDKLGRTNEIKLGDHIKQFHYLSSGDHTSNLISSVWYGDNTKLNENYRYRYDEKGNIIEIRENGTLIARYSYDSLSRLIREDNKYFNKTTTFEYDAGGNITLKSEYVFTLTSDLNEKTPTAIYPYLYKSSGWRDQLVSYNGETFEYDELGNPTTCRGETFVWNGRQLVQLGDCKYTYNANGIRTSKTVNGVKTKFFLNGNKILAQDDGNKIYYHYGVDGIVGFTLKLSDTIIHEYTYKKNIQGDIIGIYDSNNLLICKYIYDAWGNHKTLILSNNGDYVDISSTQDYTNINSNYIFIANLNPFRYRGYYFDTETGLYYLNTRYYDPELGRFINADAIDILSTAKEELNGLNLYAYCFNNPVNDIDENGNWSWNKFWKAVGGFIATVVVVGLVTAAVALTAGGVAFALGASSAVINTIVTGSVVGGIVAGGMSYIGQGISNGFDNINIGTIAIDTFTGSAYGAIAGSIGGTPYVSDKILATLGNVLVSGTSTILHGINENKSTEEIINDAKQSMAFTLLLQSLGIGFLIFNTKNLNGNTKNILIKVLQQINNSPVIKTAISQFFKGITNIIMKKY